MAEHQSTNNPNMVLRLSLYYFNCMYNYVKSNDLNVFSETLIKVLKPELYVVYNGLPKMKEEIITIDNNFIEKSDTLSVTVKSTGIKYLNIDEITKTDKNNIVNFYSFFIDDLRETGDVNKTVDNCKNLGFTFDFLEKKEWIYMALMEYSKEREMLAGVTEYAIECALERALEVAKEQVEEEYCKII
ncbi:MAG: hypothetical protein ACK5LT_12490 [Lachnospirales bacterium]